MLTTITVDYQQDGGWHVFTSKDVQELLVAHVDPWTAFADIAVVLEGLMRRNAGISCKFKPEMTAEEFFADHEHVTPRVHFRKAA